MISVILAVKNGEPLIAEQLEALEALTYRGAWELIVVDNRSTDATARCVEQFTDRLPNLRLVGAHAKAGQSYARNAGVGVAAGEHVLFIDHDDRVTPEWLTAMAVAFETADAVGGNNLWFRVAPDGTEKVKKTPYEDHPMHGLDFLPLISGGNCGMRRSLFLELGGFDESYVNGEDVELFWRVILAGHDVAFVADALLEVRLRTGSRATWKQSFRDASVIPKLYREFRAAGMPRSSTSAAMHSSVYVVKSALRRLRGEQETREDWVRELASHCGRFQGSLRNRVIYL